MIEDMIFVFGSNERGVHGAGAAWVALNKFGAIDGQGVGLQGQSYGIPTKGMQIQSLNIEKIAEYVNEFIEFAKANPDMNFKVTQIGCGLAGNKPEEIAPLFVDAPANCYFDSAWEPYLPDGTKYWGTF